MIKQINTLILFFTISLIQANLVTAQIKVYDDFESTDIKDIWKTKRMELSAFEIQSDIVRQGESAAKITLRSGDMANEANGLDLANERDELLERYALKSVEGKTYEYKFSMFLPDTFPIVAHRLVIAQWKQSCKDLPCSKFSPVIAIRYEIGYMKVTLQTTDSTRTLFYINKEDLRNQWLDFNFKIRFSRENDGLLIAHLNDKKVVDYKGITSYNYAYVDKENTYYFKMGLYRDQMEEPMSIYIDEYSKTELNE